MEQKVKKEKEVKLSKNTNGGNSNGKLGLFLMIGLPILLVLSLLVYMYINKEDKKDTVDNTEKVSDIVNDTDIKNIKDLEVINKEGLLYIHADTCVHCQELKPTIVKYLKSKDKLNFKGMNLDYTNKELAVKVLDKYQYTKKFQGTPTLLYIKDGKVKDEFIGSGTTLEMIPTKTK